MGPDPVHIEIVSAEPPDWASCPALVALVVS
jgi:hypothetical protein